MMSEDGEPSDERDDEGGPCGFESDPPFSSVGSVAMAGWWIVRGLCLQRVDQVERKDRD